MSGVAPIFRQVPTAFSGASIVDLDESPVVEIKSTSGAIHGWHMFNPAAGAAVYVQFFNARAADVTLGTTTPTLVIGIPANDAVVMPIGVGIPFGTAISVAAATTPTGNGAPTDVVAAILYE